MKRMYDVIVTRDTTESCTMTIEATSPDKASEAALLRARESTALVWEQDDTPNASADPYVTHCEVTS